MVGRVEWIGSIHKFRVCAVIPNPQVDGFASIEEKGEVLATVVADNAIDAFNALREQIGKVGFPGQDTKVDSLEFRSFHVCVLVVEIVLSIDRLEEYRLGRG